MGGSGKRSTTAPALAQHMYFLEGGLLVVSNLLKTDAWVNDVVRTHCSVCVQQFLPFRRRHHCRTCGEVVCGGCSSKREVCLTDVNVQCATRICTFCMIRATDASIKLNDTAVRETFAIDEQQRHVSTQPPPQSQPLLLASSAANHSAMPPGRFASNVTSNSSSDDHFSNNDGYAAYAPQSSDTVDTRRSSRPYPTTTNQQQQQQQQELSMWSVDSDLTTGSVVQLWPQELPDDESARLAIVRNSIIQRSDQHDATMHLLVSIVARTLGCPVAFIGLVDDQIVWFKASVGWDRTAIPRDDCVCALTLAQQTPLVVADTNADKRFHANTISLGAANKPMRYYAAAPISVMGQCIGVVSALDSTPHDVTTAAMTSTLEAVANIVSEVLEQRVDGSVSRMTSATIDRVTLHTRKPSTHAKHQQQQQHTLQQKQARPSETASDSSSDRGSSSVGPDIHDNNQLDLDASLHGLSLNLISGDDCDASESSQTSSSHDVFVDSTDVQRPCRSLTLASVPPEFGDSINVAMDFFQRLQSTLWREQPTRDTSIKAFELFRDARQFTRSNTQLPGTCDDVVQLAIDYANASVYKRVVAHIGRQRIQLSAQTWMDEIAFQPNIVSMHVETLRVVTHARQYPDGSTVVVAVDASTDYEDNEPDERALLFGWFIAPCRLALDSFGAVNVSCIFTQPIANQVAVAPHLSCDVMQRLRASLPPSQQQQQQQPYNARISPATTGYPPSVAPPQPQLSKRRAKHRQSLYATSSSSDSSSSQQHVLSHDFPLSTAPSQSPPPSMKTSHRFVEPGDPIAAFETQRRHPNNGSSARFTVARTISEESLSTNASGAKIVPAGRQQLQTHQSNQSQQQLAPVSHLNENERLMLDLLDKTISTQEILAAQQSEMASVIDYHGSQLVRISSAIERVESILADSGARIKRIPLQLNERRSIG